MLTADLRDSKSTEPALKTPSTWTRDAIRELYTLPFPELVFRAQSVHREHHANTEVQFCTLANIKSGNCPEDCSYCPQSARYTTGIETWSLPSVDEIREQAQAAKASGSTRLCMGAAWREVRDGKDFDHVLDMVRTVRETGLEACVTLGMLNRDQAVRLKDAGLTAYNHNIDTSPEFYPEIISTRTFEDRLRTVTHVAEAGISVCCGGIVGLGESVEDRIGFIETLANMTPQPESVPINALVPVAGTPLENQPIIDPIELARTIATARITMPQAIVRLSAGRTEMTDEAQALCFLAGANSIFTGEVLLTTPNPGEAHDHQLMAKLGMSAKS
jgi:biotin synthase